MNKWFAGLIIVAVGLPLLMFAGNLKSGISGGEQAGSSGAPEQVKLEKANADSGLSAVSQGLQEPPAATPEIYLGYRFARSNIGNDEGLQPEAVVAYTAPSGGSYGSIAPNVVYLGGNWKNNPDSLELVSDEGRIVLKYTARNVNIVAGSAQQQSLLQVLLNSRLVSSTNSGSDVKKSMATVDEQGIYNLVMDDGYHTKTVEINVRGKGFRLYKFTFG